MRLRKKVLPGLFLAALLPLYGQQSRNQNRPVVINSFKSSAAGLVLPCPWRQFAGDCADAESCTVTLTVGASDPDDDPLAFKYRVSGGEITGTGSKAKWNLHGLSPGAYTATVEVTDGRGSKLSKSTVVTVSLPNHCAPPCPTFNMSCPENVEEGQPVELVFQMSVENVESPTFAWTVTSGKIMAGEGSSKIVLDTAGLADQEVKATVEVGGLDPSCGRTASCAFRVVKPKR